MDGKREEEINYSGLMDKAKDYMNTNRFAESEYYANLALQAPNLDRNTRINLYSLKSYIHSKIKEEAPLLECMDKALKFILENKKMNDGDLGFCLIKILFRSAMNFYPEIRQFNYLTCYLLYTAKTLYENLNIYGESKNYQLIENEFFNVLKEISHEVRNIIIKS